MNIKYTMDTNQNTTLAKKEFERSLKALLVEAFAEGVPLEGTWDVELSSSNLPKWTINITKQSPESPEYEPEVIEE